MTTRILTQQESWIDTMRAIDGFEFIYHPLDKPVDELARICTIEKIDLVLCFDFEVQYLACNHRKQFIDHSIQWLLPKLEHARLEDKFFFNSWANNYGLNNLLPKPKALDEFPYVLKTGNSFSGSHVFYISNDDELSALKFDHKTQDYICQEYIPELVEYVFQFISIDGHIKESVTYKHIFSDTHKQYYIKGTRDGLNDKIAKVELYQDHLKILTRIINDLKYTGCGCIDFKIFQNMIYIFEFNTRLGGSLIFHNNTMKDFSRFAQCLTSLNME